LLAPLCAGTTTRKHVSFAGVNVPFPEGKAFRDLLRAVYTPTVLDVAATGKDVARLIIQLINGRGCARLNNVLLVNAKTDKKTLEDFNPAELMVLTYATFCSEGVMAMLMSSAAMDLGPEWALFGESDDIWDRVMEVCRAHAFWPS
jgi:hypothetical protein